MNRFLRLVLAATLLAGIPVAAQFSVPEIPFDSAVDPLKFPDNIHLGEAAGVATNSKGDVFVYTRTGHPTISLGGARAFAHGGSRLFQFDRTGKFVREIGQGLYGFLFAQQVRVDPQDNIWVVDQMSNMVMKFDPNGQVALLLGRKAEAENVPARGAAPAPAAAAPAGEGRGAAPAPAGGRGAGAGPAAEAGEGGRGRAAGPAGSGGQQDVFNRPSDVAWDAAGNIYVADGLGNNTRVAKFDKNGKFVRSWGFRGVAPGQFREVHGIAIDAQGMVYVADAGNRRIQVFDGDGNPKTMFLNVGTPAAICLTPGPRQFLYVSNSNPPNDIDTDGEIYKLDLNGKLVGRFGRAGKLLKEFGTTNGIDCRSENELYVAEVGNWRVQKITLHPR
jgi:DNA-binding beta-propeller fold protein YncE